MVSLDDLYAEACNVVSDVFMHCPTIREFSRRCESVTELGLNSSGVCIAALAGQPPKYIGYGKDKKHVEVLAGKLPEDVGKTHVRLRVGDSLKIQIQPTELLILDTYHSYTRLKQELLKHAGNVTRYLMIVNSYAFAVRGEDGASPGIMDAVAEFLKDHKRWSIVHNETKNNGLLVLQRDAPDETGIDKTYSMVTYDIPDIKWVERYVIGSSHPKNDLTGYEQEIAAKKQLDKLNRALRYGIVIGVERNFNTIYLEDKEILTGYLVYHVGFRHRPIGK